jgi:hypothetical protein
MDLVLWGYPHVFSYKPSLLHVVRLLTCPRKRDGKKKHKFEGPLKIRRFF